MRSATSLWFGNCAAWPTSEPLFFMCCATGFGTLTSVNPQERARWSLRKLRPVARVCEPKRPVLLKQCQMSRKQSKAGRHPSFLSRSASTVVAVVGAGHLRGMQDKWEAEIDMKELCRMPSQRQKSRRSWAHVILIATAGTATVASVALAFHWRRRR